MDNEAATQLINLAKEHPGVEFTLSPWHDGEWYAHWELVHMGHIQNDCIWMGSFSEASDWLVSEIPNIKKAQGVGS